MPNKTLENIATAIIIIGLIAGTIKKLMFADDEVAAYVIEIVFFIGFLLFYISRFKAKSKEYRIVNATLLGILALWVAYDGYALLH